MLADQLLGQERPADLQDVAKQRMGGGLAPTYNPRTNQGQFRPERLAMDVDTKFLLSWPVRRRQRQCHRHQFPRSQYQNNQQRSVVYKTDSMVSEPYITW